MALVQKYIVLQFKKVRGHIAPGEMRRATNPVSAEKLATNMSARFPGVAAYSIMVDEETGDMTDPRVICQFGETVDFAA